MKVEHAIKKSNEAFGITDLETKLSEVSAYVKETEIYKNLLETDIESFDRKAKTQVRLQEMDNE